MRAPSLQYLYLQKPVTMLIVISAIAVLPWIGMSDFATKGEPREAAVAVSMLQTGNWVLPNAYADEFAYKPPLEHWLIAVFSLPQGHVTEFTSRLPAALSYIALVGFSLFFFGSRTKFQEAFVAALLLVTCFEIHRSGLAARVDMLTTTFTVLSLFALFRWEEHQELKGLPLTIPLTLGCAILSKGPVGVVLPVFVFGVYLIVLNKYRTLTVFKALLYSGISALFIPLVWYVAAWKQGNSDFLDLMLAENFGRFFHVDNTTLNYELGHKNGLWYHPLMLLAGFIPWSLLAIFSLFGIKYGISKIKLPAMFQQAWAQIRSMDRLKLFSLVASVCIIVFYSIPSSKRSVYVMPAYPFIALFLAQYLLHISMHRTKVNRVFALFLATLTVGVLLVASVASRGFELTAFAGKFTQSESSLAEITAFANAMARPDFATIAVLTVLILSLCSVVFHIFSKNNLKLLYATVFLTFSINLFIDAAVMRNINNAGSSKPFARQITAEYRLDSSNTYVMNNLNLYSNLYGLNFYMNNSFRNFEKEKPSTGYFLVGEKDADRALSNYTSTYSFRLLETSYRISDARQKVCLYSFEAMR